LRRKRSARCWNDENEDYGFHFEACPCTEEDWECDFGFHRDVDTTCQPIDSKYVIDKSPPKNCYHWY